MAEKLGESELKAGLLELPDWSYSASAGSITREFKFKGFSQAFGFMARVALLAEKADHHPDWSNSYDRVSITLSTHSAGGLTKKDMALARAIDGLIA